MAEPHSMRHEATAVILAGGMSERMGRDKSMLLVDGRPMIEHICAQLKPHFEQTLISANEREKYAFLGVEVVLDKEPGQGPLMGIVSALEASRHDLNFVVACDVPRIDLDVVSEMLREARGHDAVVLAVEGMYLEPLFAVYRKTLLAAARDGLAAGRRKIWDVLVHRDVKILRLADLEWLVNLNTRADYETYLRRRSGPDELK